MAITVKCDCGKTMKLKDNAAGKRLRCPSCSAVVDVPEQDEFVDAFEEEVVEEEDDYDSRPSRRESNSRSRSGGRNRKPAPKKSASGGLIIGLAVGGGAALVLGLVVFMFLGRKPDPVAPAPMPVAVNPVTPNQPAPNQPAPNPTATLPVVTQTPPTQPAPVQPVVAAAPGSQLWVVLSNFKQAQSSGPFNKPYTIDYRIAAGAPEPGKQYVLYIGQPSGGGFIEHYMEVEVSLQSQSTVQFAIGPGALGTGKLNAYMAVKAGRQKWVKVSGELAPGGNETAAQAPPSVQQLAGAAAVGKAIAIANGKSGAGFAGQPEITVDCVVQAALPSDGFFFLVAKNAAGNGVEFEITQELRRAAMGETITTGGRIIGPSIGGPLTLQIEKRRSPGRLRLSNDTPEVLSNSVNTN